MYEAIMNGLVLAADPRQARQIVEDRRWLNHTDDYRRHQGKVVPLFPHLMDPQGSVTEADLLGVIPYITTVGDKLTYSAMNYAVAVKLTVDAPSLAAAERFLFSMRWFAAGQGVTYHGHSAPTAKGELDEKLA